MYLLRKIIILILIFIPFCIFPEDFNTYEIELIKSIPTGSSEDHLGYNEIIRAGDTSGPAGMGFDVAGNLYISDYWNERIVVYDKNLTYTKYINLKNFYIMNSAKQLFAESDGIWGWSDEYSIAKIDYSGNKLFEIDFWNDKVAKKLNHEFLVYKNYFIYFMKDGGFIYLDSLDKNKKKNKEKMIIYKNAEDFYTQNLRSTKNIDFSISNNNELINSDKIINKDYKKYLDFWKRQHKKNDENHSDSFAKYSVVTYIGMDKNNWIYFAVDIYKAIIVFDNDGYLVDAFIPRDFRYNILPAVNPEGDIFFINETSINILLYKITRRW